MTVPGRDRPKRLVRGLTASRGAFSRAVAVCSSRRSATIFVCRSRPLVTSLDWMPAKQTSRAAAPRPIRCVCAEPAYGCARPLRIPGIHDGNIVTGFADRLRKRGGRPTSTVVRTVALNSCVRPRLRDFVSTDVVFSPPISIAYFSARDRRFLGTSPASTRATPTSTVPADACSPPRSRPGDSIAPAKRARRQVW